MSWVLYLVTIISLLADASAFAEVHTLNIFRLTGAQNCERLLLRAELSRLDSAQVISAGKLKTIDTPQLWRSTEKFALDEMVARGVITESEAAEYAETTAFLEPERLTYVEVRRGVEPTWLGSTFTRSELSGNAGQTIALLRMVSGQLVSARGKLESLELPWMTEFPELAARAALRPDSRFTFEWGRVAARADLAGVIETNVRLMTVLAASEVVRLGGSLSEAMVYVHSTRAANTRLYERRYGFERVGEPEGKPGHMILRQNLKTLFARNGGAETFLASREARKLRVHDLRFTDGSLLRVRDDSPLSQLLLAELAEPLAPPTNTANLSFHLGRADAAATPAQVSVWLENLREFYRDCLAGLGHANPDLALAAIRFTAFVPPEQQPAFAAAGFESRSKSAIMTISGKKLIDLEAAQTR